MKKSHSFMYWWRRFGYVPFFISGLAVMGFGMSYYMSPMTRIELNGVRLLHQVAHRGPMNYLAGWHSQTESWTEYQNHVDTPLTKETIDEVGTLLVERAGGSAATKQLQIHPQEWIVTLKSADVVKNQAIPHNHPSIAGSGMILDNQGTLLGRQNSAAWRTERALQFLVPQFPKGKLRQGRTWTEHLEWIETIDDWKIGWQANVHWILKNYELREEIPSAHLVYEATLQPKILQEAAWAKGTTRSIQFTGQAGGEAFYNIQDKYLTSNTCSYAGALHIAISDLQRVPLDLRVGLPMATGAGTLILKIEDRINIQLP